MKNCFVCVFVHEPSCGDKVAIFHLHCGDIGSCGDKFCVHITFLLLWIIKYDLMLLKIDLSTCPHKLCIKLYTRKVTQVVGRSIHLHLTLWEHQYTQNTQVMGNTMKRQIWCSLIFPG